jgi:hypothetical protein
MGWAFCEEKHIKKTRKSHKGDALKEIDGAPTIDAVPVVRCENCKHYNRIGCSDGFGWCENMDRGTHDEFYCANGKRLEVEP